VRIADSSVCERRSADSDSQQIKDRQNFWTRTDQWRRQRRARGPRPLPILQTKHKHTFKSGPDYSLAGISQSPSCPFSPFPFPFLFLSSFFSPFSFHSLALPSSLYFPSLFLFSPFLSSLDLRVAAVQKRDPT